MKNAANWRGRRSHESLKNMLSCYCLLTYLHITEVLSGNSLILSQVNQEGNHLNTWIIAYQWTLRERRATVMRQIRTPLMSDSEECAAPLQETLTSGVFDTSHESWMNLDFFCRCSINLKITWSLSVASSPSASSAVTLMLMCGCVKDSEIMEKCCLAGFLITVSQARSMCRTTCSSQVK